ncbi:hypothetical protein T492DRAFT_906037, partial [Pavlovales sp. CCMP2436]
TGIGQFHPHPLSLSLSLAHTHRHTDTHRPWPTPPTNSLSLAHANTRSLPPTHAQALANSTRPCASRKRVVAGCFQELLFLASHGLVSLQQIAKTKRFDKTRVAETPRPIPTH